MRLNTIHRGRAAFTLVELMVAAAACLLIMAILASAFSSGTTTMRQLKSLGDMQDQLRAAGNAIRRDLTAHHFNPDDNDRRISGRRINGVKLSDQRLDFLQPSGAPNKLGGWLPPTAGFFRARCGDPASSGGAVTDEGVDNDGFHSYRATNHYLHFTSILTGGRDQDLYSATVADASGNRFVLTSPAAEIALFLDPNPTGNTGGIPTYNLICRRRLVAQYPDDTTHLQLRATSTYPDAPAVISMSGANVNTMASLTDPQNRLGGAAGVAAAPLAGFNNAGLSPANGDPATNNRVGDDVLLSNVVSFEVKLLWTPANIPTGTPAATFSPTNTDAPFGFFPQNALLDPRVQNTFDTWSSQLPNWDDDRPNVGNGPPNQSNPIPQRVRVMAVRIVIRVWDQKVQQTRQMTIVQDL